MNDADFYARAVEALQKRWWKGDKPDGPSKARELSAVKQWRKRIDDDELLLAALNLREGPPIAFLYAHKRGRHGDMNQLLAKARQQNHTTTKTLGDILNEAMRESDAA